MIGEKNAEDIPEIVALCVVLSFIASVAAFLTYKACKKCRGMEKSHHSAINHV
jgi:hypothetical protein